MMLEKNPFTHAIAAGKKQIGLWVSMSNGYAADIIAPAGYDWVVIDMEHSPNDYADTLSQLQVFAASDTTALVRPEWNDPVMVKRLLDLGAPGLVFPMIQTVKEAQKAVASTRYPPRGIRGVAGSTRATKFGRITDYVLGIEDQTTVILQLETAAALERAPDIAAVDGVNGIFFGPADIAADIGRAGQALHPDVWSLVRPVAQKLMAQGTPIGTLVTNPEFAAELLNDGFTFVACGIDTSLLARASDAALATVKKNIR